MHYRCICLKHDRFGDKNLFSGKNLLRELQVSLLNIFSHVGFDAGMQLNRYFFVILVDSNDFNFFFNGSPLKLIQDACRLITVYLIDRLSQSVLLIL